MADQPQRPQPPSSRYLIERGILGELHLPDQAHYDAWKAQSWWRRWFGPAPKISSTHKDTA